MNWLTTWFGQPEHVEIAVAAAAAIVTLGAGGALTDIGPWYNQLRKPNWQPPGWLFPLAWTTIFALATFAGVKSWDAASSFAEHGVVIGLFALNGALNILWSLLFFRLQRPDWALIEVVALWLSILALIVGLAPLSVRGSLALLPYLLWVSFAAMLNRTVVRLNSPFGRVAVSR